VSRQVGGDSRIYLKTLFEEGTLTCLTDGQLLERFATRQGETAEMAFAALLERHGPMVLRVCRNILGDRHEAQDAFQATFLVLVRKGRCLWVRDSLGPWLHRVACRAAGRARAGASRRRTLERHLADATRSLCELNAHGDLVAAVHEELDRLPERYRVPIVLCDLEGRTCAEAARNMGCPVGTIGSRLARGRERLRARLARRGVAPAVAAGSAEVSAAGLPPALAQSTIRLSLCAAMGKAGGGMLAVASVRLAEDLLRSMFMTRFVSLGAAAMACVVGLVSTWALRPSVGAQVTVSQTGRQGNTQAAAPGHQKPEPNDPFPFMNDPDRLKDFLYAEWGGMRPLIKDRFGVRFQSRLAVLYKDGTVTLWNPEHKDPVARSLRHRGPIREVTFFDESSLLITTSDESIKVWNALTGELRKEIEAHVIRPMWLSFARGGQRFVTINSERTAVSVWDGVTLEPIASLRSPGADRAMEAAVSGNGETVVTFHCGAEPSATLWDVASGRSFALLRPPSPSVAEIFADEGKSLIKSKVADRDARFWKIAAALAPLPYKPDGSAK
jgi:RNA polymerase sigma factor (sigma-70 family)